jgi:hypothetical protein
MSLAIHCLRYKVEIKQVGIFPVFLATKFSHKKYLKYPMEKGNLKERKEKTLDYCQVLKTFWICSKSKTIKKVFS